ncbi:TPA: ATP/GTP-binding protein [Serratia marcescens]|uniref:AAA family ATPase n=1 Tax=Serratia TaxID=613 RepID=UPI002DBCB373|nr:ATP-binding protein [Serratia marcescens]MEB7509102.1 ATP-binding protein [Serratia marcescens]
MATAILRYEVKNFGSFGSDGGVVELTTTSRDPHKELWRDVCGQNVNMITAIMGANASGKTTLLKPIPFLTWLFWKIPERLSEDMYLPVNRGLQKPCEIKVDFILDDHFYKYELSACSSFIFKESLYKKNDSNKFVYLFKRDVDMKSLDEFGKKVEGIQKKPSKKGLDECLKTIRYTYKEKSDLFPLGLAEGKRTPCNTSIISSARRVGVDVADNIAIYMASKSNVSFFGRNHPEYSDIEDASEFFYDSPESMKMVTSILKKWDLGLDDIRIEKEEVKGEDGKVKESYLLFGIHTLENGTKFELPFYLESAGTQSAYIRLFDIITALATGGHCFIDELGDDLHPHMVKPILELFSSHESNPLGAQLVFACHKPELINYLGKNRVIICEKNHNISECFRLDEFPASEARADDNLAAKYLAGAFGGVPDL